MHTVVLLVLLAVVLSFLSPSIPRNLRSVFAAHPALLFLAPVILALLFSVLAYWVGAGSLSLTLLVLGYTLAPALAAYPQGAGGPPKWLDFAAILLLWLPLEFSAGQHLVPKAAQGFLHSAAYGMALLLALTIFLGFRALPGMKYQAPSLRDLAIGVAAFVLAAPILVGLGRLLGFIPPWHLPVRAPAAGMARTVAAIFAGTALPEEILFRSLIQSWLTQYFGYSKRVLLAAALIFGCAHLDNGPQAMPNWRYMILATIAGAAYGKAFQESSSVFASVTSHALTDATKHIFF